MPTNLYGPNDYFHPKNSHVLPALLMRFHEAAQRGDEQVVVWGSGNPRREFLHVDDMADASLFVLGLDRTDYEAATQPMLSHINVGTGRDVSIRELARLISNVTGFKGEVSFDASKPDGTMRKLLDVSLLDRLGWSARIDLEDGIRQTYDWFLSNAGSLRQ
jgi:nucleoside-diphosphate-sugar epimerase